uniref:Uncharacterized protein n=1 Tax=viral metagenome TaxID=1070528 RepID=A0A6C0JAJ4_9ZZZZ
MEPKETDELNSLTNKEIKMMGLGGQDEDLPPSYKEATINRFKDFKKSMEKKHGVFMITKKLVVNYSVQLWNYFLIVDFKFFLLTFVCTTFLLNECIEQLILKMSYDNVNRIGKANKEITNWYSENPKDIFKGLKDLLINMVRAMFRINTKKYKNITALNKQNNDNCKLFFNRTFMFVKLLLYIPTIMFIVFPICFTITILMFSTVGCGLFIFMPIIILIVELIVFLTFLLLEFMKVLTIFVAWLTKIIVGSINLILYAIMMGVRIPCMIVFAFLELICVGFNKCKIGCYFK